MNTIRRIIKLLDSIVDMAVLSVLLLLLAYGIFVLLDTGGMFRSADSARYSIYRPVEEDSLSFEELRAMNPEVFGWLTVYGTHIDYPLVQAENNDKYIYTDAKGNYAASGSLFLDYRNKKDLSDFNSIIYGHHMDHQVMFGEIADFRDKSYFDSHQYGTIYYNGQTHGLEFFAFLEMGVSTKFYTPGIKESKAARDWLNMVMKNALYVRDTDVGINDHIVLLSTCTSDITNGRHILAGKLIAEVPDNPFLNQESQEENKVTLFMYLKNLPGWAKIIIGLAVLVLLAVSINVTRVYLKRRKG